MAEIIGLFVILTVVTCIAYSLSYNCIMVNKEIKRLNKDIEHYEYMLSYIQNNDLSETSLIALFNQQWLELKTPPNLSPEMYKQYYESCLTNFLLSKKRDCINKRSKLLIEK